MPRGSTGYPAVDSQGFGRYRFAPRFPREKSAMALNIGLLGKKIGMTQVFADDGEAVPVTVIQAGPCHVVGTRTVERDGYSALVLGFDEKPLRNATKPELGASKASNTKPQRFIRELRLNADEVAKYSVG